MKRTLFSLLEKRLRETPDRAYLLNRDDGINWRKTSWLEYWEQIERLSKALIGSGIGAGDKISIIGPGSPKWFAADMATMTIGATTAPIYITSSAEQISYIINHASSRILFIEDIHYYERIRDSIADMPGLERIVLLNGTASGDTDLLTDLAQFEKAGSSVTDQRLREARDAVTEDMIATYIYTSGTTGNPKAVMLSQKNYHATALSVAKWQEFMTRDKTIPQIKHACFLTLAHVFERTMSLTAPMMTGACVYFANLDNALEELKEIQPSIVVALPRTWEKMHEGLLAYRGSMPEKKQKIFDWALETGSQTNRLVYEGRSIPLGLKLKHGLAQKLVISKVKDALGCFNDAKHIMTGGAVSSKEVIDFFFSLGIWICQVYGQTEALGMGAAETKDHLRFGSVGKAFPYSEIKTAPDGEIMVKSDMVSPGYYNKPELNGETFKEGWLYSGDLGTIDEDGYLFITGRKKDIIITSGAKNITPAKIESSLMSSPLIETAVVVGDGRKYLTALLTLSIEGGAAFAATKGKAVSTYSELMNLDGVQQEIERHVALTNEKFSRVEQIKKFSILPGPLSESNGELTSLQKIKRFKVIQNYPEQIEQMYQ